MLGKKALLMLASVFLTVIVTGQKSEVTGQSSGVTGQSSGVTGQKSGIAGQSSGVAGQSSGVTIQKSGVTGSGRNQGEMIRPQGQVETIRPQSQGNMITGRVTDCGGVPMAGASVVLTDAGMGVATDNEGRYALRGLSDGSYNLRISFTGYEPHDTLVVVRGSAVVDVVLNEVLYLAPEVIVRGSRAGVRTPMAHSTIGSDELRKRDLTRDMPFLLALTPSVVETSDAGTGIGYTSMRIRGTDASRINITLDGIPLNDSESQQVFWVDLPDLASSTGSVQVQRGVGTSTNGAGAFGASVNISSQTPPSEAGASVDMSYGSFNTSRFSAKAWTGMLGDRFNMMIRASDIRSDGYVEHSAADIKSAMISGLWSAPSDMIRFNVITGNQKTGISWWGVPVEILPENRRYNPAGEYVDSDGITRYYEDETDVYTQNHYHLFYSHLFPGRVSLNTGLHLTTGLGYYEEQNSDIDLAEYGLSDMFPSDPAVREPDIVQRKWLDNIFYGTVWSLIRHGAATEWTLGGALNRYDGDHFGTILWLEYPGDLNPGHEWYRNRGLKDEVNIYGKVNTSLTGSLSGFLDLQLRHIIYRFEGPDANMKKLDGSYRFLFFNPKAGLFWSNGSGSEAFVSAAVAHREPTRAEYKDAAGDHSATPDRERLIDFEGGYTFRNSTAALGVNLYYMRYRDQLVPTGKISITGYPIKTNVPDSYRTGVELSGNYRPSPVVALMMNLTLSRSRIRNFRNHYFNYNTDDWSEEYLYKDLGTVDIAYSPRVTGSARLEISPAERFLLSLTGKYVGRQYFDNTMSADRAIDPYFVSSFSADYGFRLKKAGELKLRLMVNNLFDTRYENNAYGGMWTEDGEEKTWAYYFPQAGINYSAAVSISF
ncbi:MAG: TonB-dependent receptor [Bacteroidales bacterium]|jgi:iron complex outermembrane receptor protein|nr:TonB-dependent receptor [Bacteroidales bacterium]MBP8709465.1 TonB-dependent receptor [Bacteroidales bacterium]